MELSSTQFIPAPQRRVWDALNDPETLKSCIPGCESIEAVSASEYQVVLAAKVGPVAARFKGKLNISDSNPPNSYSLTFEGQGGVAGFAKGGANVTLAPAPSGTELSYSAKAQVGGKLAQIGSRLVDIAAKKTADDFFAAFVSRVGTSGEAVEAAEAPAASSGMSRRLAPWVIGAGALVLIAIYIAYMAYMPLR
ncbi:carbon monoxide dehydrogenase subunit G [Aromatoleum toluclasticum]|uniref:SRPBCC family protein n=1 Tax=Aromatoleum toluclasticum TaxID=92003 RepID=UPI001D1838E5|nr:carbon monoxide dehydrogenase subunit G [Aromatoleum toluclasticum]MCC4118468.1 carbon monoxide dehydrogenase subunit G [Aromatoleum toluclasticum]